MPLPIEQVHSSFLKKHKGTWRHAFQNSSMQFLWRLLKIEILHIAWRLIFNQAGKWNGNSTLISCLKGPRKPKQQVWDFSPPKARKLPSATSSPPSLPPSLPLSLSLPLSTSPSLVLLSSILHLNFSRLSSPGAPPACDRWPMV